MNSFLQRRRIALVILLVLFIQMTVLLQAKAQDTTVTATVGANVISLQAGPGLDYSSVGTATLGQTFTVIGRAHGNNRIWYKIELPSGGTAWVSERVVNISPSPDSLPWLGDNVSKTPLIMDCGRFQPALFVGAYAQVTWPQGVILYKDPGLGKPQVGSVLVNQYVKVLDGPFCTLLNMDTKSYQIQWQVSDQAGIIGYMLEGARDATQPYVQLSSDAPTADFPTPVATAVATSATSSNTASNIDRPSFVTDDDIQAVTAVFESVQKSEITQAKATDELQTLVDSHDQGFLPWIVRRVPVYDGKLRQWVSFARYDDMSLMVFNANSQLDLKPVDTTITILFGTYKDPVQEFQSIGCGGG